MLLTAYLRMQVMIDSSRHYLPVSLIRAHIDAMTYNKMNVLHFHLSEECFRVESKIYPGLTSGCIVNGHNDTAFYSQAEISHLVEFAQARGIRVIPEFDMPVSEKASKHERRTIRSLVC